jgi:hypothetical protein
MYDKELNYNFYNILAVKSGVNRGLHFNYEGRANEPNVLLADSKEVQKYVSKNLYVFSCDSEADGEMIIENECTSNYGKKVYLRFLLNTEDMAAPNEIDKLFNNSNVELDLNTIIQDEDNCVYTETSDGILITFQKPISVHSKFNGLITNPIFKTPIQEGFDVVPLYVNPDNAKDILTGCPPDGNLVTNTNVCTYKNIKYEKIDNQYGASGDYWMECDDLDVGSEFVPMYNADLRRDFENDMGNAVAMWYVVAYFGFVAILYFLMNSIYKTFAWIATDKSKAGEVAKGVSFIESILLLIVIIFIIATPFMNKTKNSLADFFASLYVFLSWVIFYLIARYQKQNVDNFGFKGYVNANPQEIKEAWETNDIFYSGIFGPVSVILNYRNTTA